MDTNTLRRAVTGSVVTSGDVAWDAARRSPAGAGAPDVIVRVASLDDVSTAVRFAAALRRPVVVRSGGHSAWCTLDDGVLVDLSALNAVEVVRDAGPGALVRVGGGARWGDVADALGVHGLAVSSGDTRSVGVGGLTLGGGIGWMVRAWGLAADQMVGVQIVTAAGDVIEADDASHPDLLWALRGGGGNFGVVTRFDFRAHDLPAVAFAELSVSGDPRPVLARLAAVLADAPRELTVTYMDVPEMDPSAPAGRTIGACWAGDDVGALRAALAPLLEMDAVTGEVGLRPYAEILLEEPPSDPEQKMPGFIGGNALVADLDGDLIDLLVAFRESAPASIVFLRSLGGAYGDVPADATAFSARSATWFAMAGAFDVPGLVDDVERERLQNAWEGIEARGVGVYGNFSTTTDRDYAEKMYPPATRDRLAAAKRRWDPDNLFSRNHNIAPR